MLNLINIVCAGGEEVGSNKFLHLNHLTEYIQR